MRRRWNSQCYLRILQYCNAAKYKDNTGKFPALLALAHAFKETGEPVDLYRMAVALMA